MAATKNKNIIMAAIKDMVGKSNNTRSLHGGTVVEVTNRKQAKHAEQAGACAVLVINPISYSSSSNNYMITASLINKIMEIKKAVRVPVMAKCRAGNSGEARILEAIGVDYIYECQELIGEDDDDDDKYNSKSRKINNYLNKHNYDTPFVCECKSLGEALKRVSEGAALIKIQDGILIFKSNNNNYFSEFFRPLGKRGSKEYCAAEIVMDKIKTLAIDHNGMAFGYSEPPLELPLAQFVGGGCGGGGSIRSPADGVKMISMGFDGVFLDPKNLSWFGRDKHVKNIIDAVRNHDRKGDI